MINRLNNLYYVPPKIKKLPKFLIYECPVKTPQNSNISVLFSPSDKNVYGEIEYAKSRVLHKSKYSDAFLVEYLQAVPENNGVGRTLLNYIKDKSIEQGMGGKFFLSAVSITKSDDVPHIFYRKFGMTTGNNDIDKKIDKFVKEKKKATSSDFQSMVFFYSPETVEKQKSLLTRLSKFFVEQVENFYGIDLHLQ